MCSNTGRFAGLAPRDTDRPTGIQGGHRVQATCCTWNFAWGDVSTTAVTIVGLWPSTLLENHAAPCSPRSATAGRSSFPGAAPFARAAGTAPPVAGFAHPAPLPQPRPRLRRRRPLGGSTGASCGGVSSRFLGNIGSFGRGWSREAQPERGAPTGVVSMASWDGSGAGSRAFGAAEGERRARRRQRRPISFQGEPQRAECWPGDRRFDRGSTAVRPSTAAASPTLPEGGGKVPAIKSEWEAVLQGRLERKLRKPNRKRRARGAVAVGETAAAAGGGGIATPSASPYPTHSSPPTDWVQQRLQEEQYQHQHQRQQQSVASVLPQSAATTAAPPPRTTKPNDQQLSGQASRDAENTTASGIGAAGVRPKTAGATPGIEDRGVGGRWEVGEGENNAVSERTGGGSRRRNARRSPPPPPLKRWPPGGPFGASKAVAWHAQQVIQSAVTPIQVNICVAVRMGGSQGSFRVVDIKSRR